MMVSPRAPRGLFQFFQQRGFHVVGVGIHFAGGNFCFGGAVEA